MSLRLHYSESCSICGASGKTQQLGSVREAEHETVPDYFKVVRCENCGVVSLKSSGIRC
jgi:uncharacterized Zn finger protein